MRRLKQRIYPALSEDMRQTLRENEWRMNRLVYFLLLAMSAVSAFYWVLSKFGVISYLTDYDSTATIMSIVARIVIVSALCLPFRFKKRFLKYIIILSFINVVNGFNYDIALGENILMIVPLVMSVRYYSLLVSAFASVSSFLSIYSSSMLYIVLGSDTLEEVRSAAETMFFRLLPVHLLVITLCLVMTIHGRIVLYHQAETSKRMAMTQADLDMARDIQSAQLPGSFPQRSEFDIFAKVNTAKEVGGDLYDCFMIDDDHLGILVGDVSGKGVPAGLFMMVTKSMIQYIGLQESSPSEVIRQVNAQLCKNNAEKMFVTLWYGVLTISTGQVVAVNAGHNYPVLKNSEGKFEQITARGGLLVGALPTAKYRENTFTLQEGSTLFVYTDGVEDACNKKNEQFGLERIIQTLNDNAQAAPQALIASVEEAINTFVGGEEQFDDITMLALTYHGSEAEGE